ncbi:unnamed protein product [Peronospora effusa]|nr:unnamed protein product [Peronospora effusa]
MKALNIKQDSDVPVNVETDRFVSETEVNESTKWEPTKSTKLGLMNRMNLELSIHLNDRVDSNGTERPKKQRSVFSWEPQRLNFAEDFECATSKKIMMDLLNVH